MPCAGSRPRLSRKYRAAAADPCQPLTPMPVFTKARCVAEHHPKLLEATMRRRALLRLATLPALAWPVGARAQAFPTKPVTIIVPFSAGGPLDTLCRILAEHMQGTLGQAVVIEEVTGAGGAIGITRVARSAADGHTHHLRQPGFAHHARRHAAGLLRPAAGLRAGRDVRHQPAADPRQKVAGGGKSARVAGLDQGKSRQGHGRRRRLRHDLRTSRRSISCN